MEIRRLFPTVLLLILVPIVFLASRWSGVWVWIPAAPVLLLLLYTIITGSRESDGGVKKEDCFELGGMFWKIEDFLRHWICIGKSGCGKTIAFFKAVLLQLLKKWPNFGGVFLDEKGDFHEMTEGIFKAHNKIEKLKVLRVRNYGDSAFVPKYRMNLIGDRRFPWSTWAQMIVDVAVSQGQKNPQAHFKIQATQRIADVFETLDLIGINVTLTDAYEFLRIESVHVQGLESLEEFIQETTQSIEAGNTGVELKNKLHLANRLLNSWQTLMSMGDEAKSIKSTCENYLFPYYTKEIAEIFSSDTPNVAFNCIEDGHVIMPSIPQAYETERRYIIAFFKILSYKYGLNRFDRGMDYIKQANMLVIFADEGQNSILVGEEGMADHKALDKLRAAKVTLLLGTQDFVSLIPASGNKDTALTIFTNLNNAVVFAINTEEGRKMASESFGEHYVDEVTRNIDHVGRVSRSIKSVKKPRYEPSYFNSTDKKLPKFTAVIRHCEGGHRRATLPPLTDAGEVEPWFTGTMYWK